MDPEDLREVISAYQTCVAETVPRFGGFVAKYMGDGVLIYFGYPQAHEDDAERAVQSTSGPNAFVLSWSATLNQASVLPEILETIGRHLGIANRVHDILVTHIVLKGACDQRLGVVVKVNHLSRRIW
jgi:class 3 adenylate cyclase